MIATLLAVVLQATVVFTTVARGSDSRIMEPREAVIRSVAEWQTLWKEHGTQRLPTVDFSKSTVVGVFLGTRMTAGYGVDVVSVRSQGDTTVVEYREQRPPADALLAQVLTAPFHLVSIPRTDAKIEFRRLDAAPR